MTGLWDWYEVPPEVTTQIRDEGHRLTWAALFERWGLVENDLHDRGIDVDALSARTWRWLRVRITGLLTDPTTRTARAHHADLAAAQRKGVTGG